MKKLLFFFATLTTFSSPAQPTVSSNEYITNYVDIVSHNWLGAFDAGPAGANVVWDISALPAPQTTYFINAGDCPNDTGCQKFPAANIYVRQTNTYLGGANNSCTLSKKTSDKIEFIGEYWGPNELQNVHTDFRTKLEFPVTYNQSYIDRYKTAYSYGTVNYTVDGYGTLITPAGTYTDVLRIKSDGLDTIPYASGIYFYVHHQVGYLWVKANYPKMIMSSEGTQTIYPTPDTIMVHSLYYSNTDPTTLSVKTQDKNELVHAYPNPSTDVLALSLPISMQNAQITVMDVTGRPYNISVSKSTTVHRLDVSHLPSGLYLLHIRSTTGNQCLKFQKL